MTWKETWRLIVSDTRRRILYEGLKPSLLGLVRAMVSSGWLAVVTFRLQSYLWHKNFYLGHKALFYLRLCLLGTEMDPACEIGEGFVMGNAYGISVHEKVAIGRNCTILHQADVGVKESRDDSGERFLVRVEDDVIFGHGAKVCGNGMVIGRGSLVAPGAAVLRSVPPFSIVHGIPAAIEASLDPVRDDLFGRMAKVNARQWVRPARRQPLVETLRLVHQDVLARSRVDGKKDFSASFYFRLLLNPPAQAVVLYRFQQWLYGLGLFIPARALSLLSAILYKIEIATGTEIGGGLVCSHANGIVVGNGVRMGEDCVLFHHNSVALAPSPSVSSGEDVLEIGSGSLIGAGSRIVGAVSVGASSLVGINSSVDASSPPGWIVAGNPAKPIKVRPAPEPLEDVDESWQAKLVQVQRNRRVTLPATLRLIREDLMHRARLENRPFTWFHYVRGILNPSAAAGIIFRIHNWLHGAGLYLPAKLLSLLNGFLFTVEIQSGAEIEGGLVLAHANGILVEQRAIIGKNCILTLHNSVALFPREGADPLNDRIILGDNVFIGGGARLIGKITLGDNTTVGWNAVVTKSTKPGAVVAGVPAKPLYHKAAKRIENDDPAEDGKAISDFA